MLCWIVLLMYWIINASNVKQNVEKHIAFKYIFLLSVVVVGLFVTMFYTKTFLQYTLWRTSIDLGILTDVLVVIGLVFSIWARAILGRNWSAGITFKKGHKLIKHGPYSVVRHPIYSGLILMSIGTAINIGKIYAFILLAVYVVGFNGKSRLEEELMLKHFSKEYISYKKRVKAIVPYIF